MNVTVEACTPAQIMIIMFVHKPTVVIENLCWTSHKLFFLSTWLTRWSMCSTISAGLVTCQLARVRLSVCPTAVVKILSGEIASSTGWSWPFSSLRVTERGGSIVARVAPDLNKWRARNISSSVYFRGWSVCLQCEVDWQLYFVITSAEDEFGIRVLVHDPLDNFALEVYQVYCRKSKRVHHKPCLWR